MANVRLVQIISICLHQISCNLKREIFVLAKTLSDKENMFSESFFLMAVQGRKCLVNCIGGVKRRFQHHFGFIAAVGALTDTFLEFLLLVLLAIFFPSHWLLSHITMDDTVDSSERAYILSQ